MWNAGRVAVAVAVASSVLALMACSDGPLSEEERAALREFLLPAAPPANPTNQWADDPEAAALGQQFFFDTRFSGPLLVGSDGLNGGLGAPGEVGRVSCASCHDPADGGVDHRSRPSNTSLAAGWTGRHSPTVLNAAFASSPWTFWDGRKDSLWSQALGPGENSVEHNGSRLQFAHLIYDLYRAEYEALFGSMPDLADTGRFPPEGKPNDPAWEGMAAGDKDLVNRVYANFGKAIEAYERELVSGDSAFDRYMEGEESALSASALRGAKLFVGRAACNECHRGPILSDGRFHNLGVPQSGCAACPPQDRGRAAGIAGVLGDPFNRAGAFSDAADSSHLAALAAGPRDEGAFKTPTLRNVSRTAPYMHTGSLATLRDVVAFYRDGGGVDGFAGGKDPAIRPLALSDHDVDDLVAFLLSLEGADLPAALVTAPPLP